MQVLILHTASTFAWTLPSLPLQWRRLYQSHVISWHIHNACIRQQAMCVELFEIEMETACRSWVRSRCFFFAQPQQQSEKKIERDLSLFFISHLLFCSIGIRMNSVCMFSEIFFFILWRVVLVSFCECLTNWKSMFRYKYIFFGRKYAKISTDFALDHAKP